MTILYYLNNTAYVNITNRCSANCDFCLRGELDGMGNANSLWLEREPTREEILMEIANAVPNPSEIVFCGFGEPFERLDDMLWVIGELKRRQSLYVRINTNGHGNLIAGEDVTPKLYKLVDALSISLNYPNAGDYERHCRPRYRAAFEGMLDFTRLAKRFVPSVTLTVVDVLSASHIEECRKIAEGLDVNFRVRAKQ
ncbi:radical SAM protein [Clostridia bacterium]|nr:radical SAM protein [Clostridia bacterium]